MCASTLRSSRPCLAGAARGGAMLGIAVLILAAAPVGAQTPSPSPAAALPVEITGATFAEFDDNTGILRMEGAPLVLTRGRTTLRAPRARYERRARVVYAEGGVDLTEPGIAIRADAAEYRLDEEWVRGVGDVVASHTRQGEGTGEEQPTVLRAPEVFGSLRTRRFTAIDGVTVTRGEWTLSGRRVEYDDGSRVAVVTGDPRLRAREVTMTAQVITLFLDREAIRGEGTVVMRRADMIGVGPRVDIFMKEQVAVLSGGARVDRGADRVTADEIEAALDGSRIIARGTSRLVVVPSPSPTPTR